MLSGTSLFIGLGASLAAAVLIAAGLVLQAFEARDVESTPGVRLTLIGRLLRRPRWLIGTAIGYLAFPFQLLSLAHAPLIVVQPVQAFGLLIVFAVGLRVLRERARPLDLAAVAAILLGVAMLAWGAPAGRDPEVSSAALATVTAAAVLIAWVPCLLGSSCGRLALMICSGIGFAAVNIAVKGLVDELSSHMYLAAAGYLAAAAAGSVAATLSQMTAFQRYPAVEVVPITYAIPNFLPVVVALLVLHESWSGVALAGAPFALGAVLLLLGTATMARATPVARVVRAASG